MVKKILMLAAALVLLTAGVAHGQDYTSEDDATVDDSTVEPGDEITISAEVFLPGSTVTFTLFSAPVVLGQAVADADGVATLTTRIPENTAPGVHTIEASGIGADGEPLTVTTQITVLGAGGTAPGGDLPDTGSDSISMTQAAIAAIAGGGLLVLLANKRRTAKAAEREPAGV